MFTKLLEAGHAHFVVLSIVHVVGLGTINLAVLVMCSWLSAQHGSGPCLPPSWRT